MRGIAVLRRLTEADGAVSLSGLERATGLARSTVDRITGTLARMGYVRLDGRDAMLAPRLMELGNAYLAALRLPRLLGAHADALADELDESVSLAVGDQDGIRFIHQATRRRAMSLSFRIGDLLPAERTAPGPLFATEWGEGEWTRWRARRSADPEDRGFPAVPARSRPIDADESDEGDGIGGDGGAGGAGGAGGGDRIHDDGEGPRDHGWSSEGWSGQGRSGESVTGGLLADGPGAGTAGSESGSGGLLADGPGSGTAGSGSGSGASGSGGLGDDFEHRTARARETGWALDDQLIEPGLVALSVPVRDPGTGRIACVVSVVSHTSRHTAQSLRRTLLSRLRAAVDAMERELRQAPPPDPSTATCGLASWTGASKQELGRDFVESLARGLTVVACFDEGHAELSLTEVARTTGLARATARRALITLEHLGYVTAHDRVFRLTPRVLGLGFPPLSRTSLPEIATPHLTALSHRLHESTSLAILTGDLIQYTARVPTHRIMSVNVTIGTRLPAHATSLGRVLLAGLPPERRPVPPPDRLPALTPRTITEPAELAAVLERVRVEGYAFVDEELEVGLRAMAVPVRDREGRVVAAVNVAMHSSRRTPRECRDEVLPQLRAAADRVEADLHLAGRFVRIPTG
ncbi:IclR family transcriptional regulator C-terminal domain-containing protein [Streptomyces sp. NPDC008313]|uniref:IclR family transcriptional regulator domain-containing protein n=1 Tax=Streptomyces sp. NPDC008313 TaxID=3364826 RepID=UPI0036E1548E